MNIISIILILWVITSLHCFYEQYSGIRQTDGKIPIFAWIIVIMVSFLPIANYFLLYDIFRYRQDVVDNFILHRFFNCIKRFFLWEI